MQASRRRPRAPIRGKAWGAEGALSLARVPGGAEGAPLPFPGAEGALPRAPGSPGTLRRRRGALVKRLRAWVRVFANVRPDVAARDQGFRRTKAWVFRCDGQKV